MNEPYYISDAIKAIVAELNCDPDNEDTYAGTYTTSATPSTDGWAGIAKSAFYEGVANLIAQLIAENKLDPLDVKGYIDERTETFTAGEIHLGNTPDLFRITDIYSNPEDSDALTEEIRYIQSPAVLNNLMADTTLIDGYVYIYQIGNTLKAVPQASVENKIINIVYCQHPNPSEADDINLFTLMSLPFIQSAIAWAVEKLKRREK